VSALVRRLDGDLEAWRTRSLAGTAYPVLIIDAHNERVRREGQVQSTAALWVIGITAVGYREHLGVWLGASESEASWHQVAKDLVADDHAGLGGAFRQFFPTAQYQRCQVHYLRNALDKVSRPSFVTAVVAGLHDVWAALDRAEAERRVVRLCAALGPGRPRVGGLAGGDDRGHVGRLRAGQARDAAASAHDEQHRA
jgi:transposase-like protein